MKRGIDEESERQQQAAEAPVTRCRVYLLASPFVGCARPANAFLKRRPRSSTVCGFRWQWRRRRRRRPPNPFCAASRWNARLRATARGLTRRKFDGSFPRGLSRNWQSRVALRAPRTTSLPFYRSLDGHFLPRASPPLLPPKPAVTYVVDASFSRRKRAALTSPRVPVLFIIHVSANNLCASDI